jgi:putative redox protein
MAKVTTTWQHQDLLLEAENDSGNKIVLDSAEHVGGKNRGARPLQLMLMSLAGCTSMDVLSLLKKMRQDFSDFQVVVTADQASDHPKVYTRIHVEYVVTGNVQEDKLQRAIQLSEQTYCPASAMLRQAVEITSSYRIVPADG